MKVFQKVSKILNHQTNFKDVQKFYTFVLQPKKPMKANHFLSLQQFDIRRHNPGLTLTNTFETLGMKQHKNKMIFIVLKLTKLKILFSIQSAKI